MLRLNSGVTTLIYIVYLALKHPWLFIGVLQKLKPTLPAEKSKLIRAISVHEAFKRTCCNILTTDNLSPSYEREELSEGRIRREEFRKTSALARISSDKNACR